MNVNPLSHQSLATIAKEVSCSINARQFHYDFRKMERLPEVCRSFFPENQVSLEAMTVSRQAGYSPWAWASLFDATATAERMEAHWY